MQKTVNKIVAEVKDKKGVNKGKGTLLMEELKKKIPGEEYDGFIDELCSDAKYWLFDIVFKSYIAVSTPEKPLDKQGDTNKNDSEEDNKNTIKTYRTKTNAYSLSVLIYFIVYNMGCYHEEDDLISTSAWRFLNRYSPVDPAEPSEIELSKIVPAPLELEPESELLMLVQQIDSFDHAFTLNDENKEFISMNDSQKASTPLFSLKNID